MGTTTSVAARGHHPDTTKAVHGLRRYHRLHRNEDLVAVYSMAFVVSMLALSLRLAIWWYPQRLGPVTAAGPVVTAVFVASSLTALVAALAHDRWSSADARERLLDENLSITATSTALDPTAVTGMLAVIGDQSTNRWPDTAIATWAAAGGSGDARSVGRCVYAAAVNLGADAETLELLKREHYDKVAARTLDPIVVEAIRISAAHDALKAAAGREQLAVGGEIWWAALPAHTIDSIRELAEADPDVIRAIRELDEAHTTLSTAELVAAGELLDD